MLFEWWFGRTDLSPQLIDHYRLTAVHAAAKFGVERKLDEKESDDEYVIRAFKTMTKSTTDTYLKGELEKYVKSGLSSDMVDVYLVIGGAGRNVDANLLKFLFNSRAQFLTNTDDREYAVLLFLTTLGDDVRLWDLLKEAVADGYPVDDDLKVGVETDTRPDTWSTDKLTKYTFFRGHLNDAHPSPDGPDLPVHPHVDPTPTPGGGGDGSGGGGAALLGLAAVAAYFLLSQK